MFKIRDFKPLFTRVDIPEEHAAHIRGEQIAAFKKALPFGFVATFMNAAILVIYALSMDPDTRVIFWGSSIGLLILLSIPTILRAWKTRHNVRPRTSRDLKKPIYNALTFGVVWGAAPMFFLPNATPATQLLLTAICAGMMSGGAYIFSTVPKAAIGFVATVAFGFIAGIFLTELGSTKWPLIALTIVYTLIMLNSARWNYANYVRAWLQKIELDEQKEALGQQNEVIGLLLKDFELTTSDCLWETDREGYLIRVTEDLAERLNIPGDLSQPVSLINFLRDRSADPEEFERLLVETLSKDFFRDAIVKIDVDEKTRWLCFSGKRKPDGGFRGVVADVTESQQAAQQIHHMAHYDGLTQLANREHFRTEIDTAFQELSAFALLCIDLDRFKAINDLYGHLTGDKVLALCAERMTAVLDEQDIAARFGGDEFVVLQKTYTSKQDTERLANRLITALSKPIIINDITLHVGASIGIAMSPEDGLVASDLLRNADLALYQAKHTGRNQACLFDQALGEKASIRHQIERDLRQAIQKGHFKLFYQPLVDSKTRDIVGFETLLRWDHPKHGLISPEDFIDVAEQSGMITSIGEWVIREALKEAACWTDEQRISINLSPIQISATTLIPTVVNALAATNVAPNRLELEITESALLDESEETLRTLGDLHKLGVRISLDDFGTGYSSLSHLSSFPFDKIKIDKSFVKDIQNRPECRAIVRAIAGLAGTLGIRATAEGVETLEQVESVLAEGCTELQGFYFAEPFPAETLEATGLLRRNALTKSEHIDNTHILDRAEPLDTGLRTVERALDKKAL